MAMQESRLKTESPSCSTRGAVGDIFTVLAHSDWCRVFAGPAARHQANEKVPSQESNAIFLANTRRRSKIVVRGKLGASSATHDALGELPTRICGGVAVEVACPSGRCCCPRLGLVALCTRGSALFLKSETVAIMTRTFQWDGGKTALREARKCHWLGACRRNQ